MTDLMAASGHEYRMYTTNNKVMLSEREKQGISNLLMQLDLEDLLTLTDTVTNRVVSAETRQEAVQAILLYTANASQLLKRKKVRREHLYKYLAEQGCIESTTSDKPFLCRKILKLWGSPGKEIEVNDDTDDFVQSTTTGNEQNAISSRTVQPINKAIVENEGQKLAEHFIPWFYRLLNSVTNRSTESVSQDCWGDHHFWDDAKCSIKMISNDHTEENCQGAVASSNKLIEVLSSEQLFLNVNHSSIKGDMDTYGLARIVAGGTVHRFQQCLGLFEQSFGLIRDPLTDNNWKIKFTHLKLKAQGQTQGRQIEAAAEGTKELGQ